MPSGSTSSAIGRLRPGSTSASAACRSATPATFARSERASASFGSTMVPATGSISSNAARRWSSCSVEATRAPKTGISEPPRNWRGRNDAMPLETMPWDVAEHLDNDEAIAAYVDAALEDGDPALIAAALGDIARARGMAQIASETGLSRESLYRALSAKGNPEFGTILAVMRALGIRLSAKPFPASA